MSARQSPPRRQGGGPAGRAADQLRSGGRGGLQELKVRLEFNPAAAQNREALKEGEVNLDHIKALTADAQQLASDLNNFGGTVPVAATPSEAAKPADARYVRALDEIGSSQKATRRKSGSRKALMHLALESRMCAELGFHIAVDPDDPSVKTVTLPVQRRSASPQFLPSCRSYP